MTEFAFVAVGIWIALLLGALRKSVGAAVIELYEIRSSLNSLGFQVESLQKQMARERKP